MGVPEGRTPDWRRGGLASAGAIVATLLLIGLMIMVTRSNSARDEALASERHSYDVMLLTRTVDATIARSEAALGRFVLDEERETGSLYYNEWQLAARQIGELERLVRNGNVNPLGLFDLDRNIRPVGTAYKQLIRDWGDVLPAQSVCLIVPVVPPSKAGGAHAREQEADAARAMRGQDKQGASDPELGP